MRIPWKLTAIITSAALLVAGTATAVAQSSSIFGSLSSSNHPAPEPSQTSSPSSTPNDMPEPSPTDTGTTTEETTPPQPTEPVDEINVGEKRSELKDAMVAYYEGEGYYIDEWLDYMAQLIADQDAAGHDTADLTDKGIFTIMGHSNDEMDPVIESFRKGEISIIPRSSVLGIGVAGSDRHTVVVIYWA